MINNGFYRFKNKEVTNYEVFLIHDYFVYRNLNQNCYYLCLNTIDPSADVRRWYIRVLVTLCAVAAAAGQLPPRL